MRAAGRRKGIRSSHASRAASNMASFLRKEIQAAVREELSRVINSTGTATDNCSNPTTSTGAAATENNRSSRSVSRFAGENSERALSFEMKII